ncbi:hypothetical protein M758_9G106400 [Ceratodon purpureus]|nr:hypothetical protein M758_9G106400 [Ceratodon purpureus]
MFFFKSCEGRSIFTVATNIDVICHRAVLKSKTCTFTVALQFL